MAKAQNKTQPTEVSPIEFIETIEHPQRKADGLFLLGWFEEITGLKPKMWGPTMIGYGRYHYQYESGREGEMFTTGFSPRTGNLSLYVLPSCESEGMQDKLSRLGKHKLGKSCLYINKLADVDLEVLEEIVREGLAIMKATHETFDE